MEFLRFNNIKNYDDIEFWKINKVFEDRTRWVVTEKLDGSNFQICCDENGKITFGSREKFIDNMNDPMIKNINLIKDIVDSMEPNMILYGEFFGNKVINRISYNCKYQYKFFAMRTNGKMRPFLDFRYWMNEHGFEKYIVPIIGVYDNLEHALNVDYNFITHIDHKDIDNEAEGIIIEPYDLTIYFGESIFKIKRKNKKYREGKAKPMKKNIFLHNIKEYLNENRMYSLISKIGYPKSTSEYGKYINDFIMDAIEEYNNARDDKIIDDEIKALKKANSSIGFKILKNIMNK